MKRNKDQSKLTTGQASEIAGVSRRTVFQWCVDGLLPAERREEGARTRFLIKRTDFLAFLKQNPSRRKPVNE